MATERLVERVLGILALGLLAVACLLVVRPFLSALMFAAILCFSTWPVYAWIERHTHGRRTLAASLMTCLVALVLIAPFAVVVATLADNVTNLTGMARSVLDNGLPAPPSWLGGIPVVGEMVVDYWNAVGAGEGNLFDTLKGLAGPATEFALVVGAKLGTGVLELCLSVFVAFFLYRSGQETIRRLATASERFAGERIHRLVHIAGATVTGVVYGVLGTALAQGILNGLGLWVAGVPGALLLGFVTFVVSLIPMGPPLVWLPATVWLLAQGSIGWAIFMGAWGLFLVSGVDNILKPYLISCGSSLPFVLVFLGAVGGILAFGFIGLFLGPTLLAVGYSLLNEWSAHTVALATSPEAGPPADGGDRARDAGDMTVPSGRYPIVPGVLENDRAGASRSANRSRP
jgi:predicted PurR-regulated permease PerM